MHVAALRVNGYRNLTGIIALCQPLAVIVGENNAGKSNVIDALRTVLEPELGPRLRCWLTEDDFAHNGKGERTTDELELEVQLADLDLKEQSRLCTCLSPSLGSGTARIRLQATLGDDGRVRTQWFGGDSDHPESDRHAREAVRFVYLHPLRDAAADLRPGRDNRLIGLIEALAPTDHSDRDAIVAAAKAANDALDQIPTIASARTEVAGRLKGMTGRGRFAQQSGLAFDDPVFRRVVGALRAKIGQQAALEMTENGLGYNNLLYMAVLLAAMAHPPGDEEPTLRVLLVEEPEAHLHPQLQDLLMHFLESEASAHTQVIVTSHSPNFASSARVERLTVLARGADDELSTARLPREFGLDDKQLSYLHRFLDVTKAALFFARAVILVEGVAEQLLVPVFAERMGRRLAPNGVTVINVGGVAFPPFTDLFGNEKLPYRLSVISDSDSQPAADELEGAPVELSPRAQDLLERVGANVTVKLAARTLEWDLAVEPGNISVMLEALANVKPKVAKALGDELASLTPEQAADKLLDKVKDVKGRFAQELAQRLADPKVTFAVPAYLEEAIAWVADKVADEAGQDETGTDEPPPGDATAAPEDPGAEPAAKDDIE